MPYQFLSDGWFQEVDKLIAAAGDLQIPPAMKAVEVNVTVTSATGTDSATASPATSTAATTDPPAPSGSASPAG